MTEEINLEETVGTLVADWNGSDAEDRLVKQNELVRDIVNLCKNYAREERKKVHEYYKREYGLMEARK